VGQKNQANQESSTGGELSEVIGHKSWDDKRGKEGGKYCVIAFETPRKPL